MPRLQDALTHFKRVDPHFYRATRAHHASLPGTLSAKKTRAQLFASLVSTVVSQQLGLAAAAAILSRVKGVCKGRLAPESILTTPPSIFRKTGLSGAKIKTLKEISKAIKNKSLDLLALKKVSEAEAAEQLMAIWGLGPWSSEMFLIFALGRADVFSSGDLGLIRAMEQIYDLPPDSPRPSLLAIAEKWSPYRTYASLLLWRTRDTK